MKINLTKEQYKELVFSVAIANGILGILGDAIEIKNYKELSKRNDSLENHILQYADSFDCGELAQFDDGGVNLDDEYYEEVVLPVIYEYEEFSFFENLANKLAWRDFRNDYTEKELEEMSEKNGGYFGKEIFDYEKKYWDEFDENGLERLVVKE